MHLWGSAMSFRLLIISLLLFWQGFALAVWPPRKSISVPPEQNCGELLFWVAVQAEVKRRAIETQLGEITASLNPFDEQEWATLVIEQSKLRSLTAEVGASVQLEVGQFIDRVLAGMDPVHSSLVRGNTPLEPSREFAIDTRGKVNFNKQNTTS